MAIKKVATTLSYQTQKEIASRVMLFTRTVREIAPTIEAPEPSVAVDFGAIIHPIAITYELDETSKKVGIYESEILKEFEVSQARLMALFMIEVTLKDGTPSTVGSIISNFADQLIHEQVGIDPTDEVTTQHINMG